MVWSTLSTNSDKMWDFYLQKLKKLPDSYISLSSRKLLVWMCGIHSEHLIESEIQNKKERKEARP